MLARALPALLPPKPPPTVVLGRLRNFLTLAAAAVKRKAVRRPQSSLPFLLLLSFRGAKPKGRSLVQAEKIAPGGVSRRSWGAEESHDRVDAFGDAPTPSRPVSCPSPTEGPGLSHHAIPTEL